MLGAIDKRFDSRVETRNITAARQNAKRSHRPCQLPWHDSAPDYDF
jgi:hypothetical protein